MEFMHVPRYCMGLVCDSGHSRVVVTTSCLLNPHGQGTSLLFFKGRSQVCMKNFSHLIFVAAIPGTSLIDHSATVMRFRRRRESCLE
jgi:hypothetical protein